MKRTFAVVVLLAALGVLCKLAVKPEVPRPGADATSAGAFVAPAEPDPDAALLAKYPHDRDLVARTLRRYRQTARTIERTDGLRGLVLLDRLDLEAIHLYERYPGDFRRLRDCLNDDAAADLLLHWREYFGLKRADDTDRGILIAEIARLSPAQRRGSARHPNPPPPGPAAPGGVAPPGERGAGGPTGPE